MRQETKVLLFMGYRKPIMTTEVGIEGIEVRGREDVMVIGVEDFPNALRSFQPRPKRDESICPISGAGYSPEVMSSKVDELLERIYREAGSA